MAQSMRRLIHAAILAVVVMLFSSAAQHAHAELTVDQQTATAFFIQQFRTSIPSLALTWANMDYCNWDGITCETNGFLSINLNDKGLSGAMPPVPTGVDGSLVAVVSIDMSNNPNIVGGFEESWASLSNLQTLALSSTGLYGSIPDSWNGMASLQSVTITNTNACKGLPNWNIASLRTVDLSNNKLSGALANSWGSMTGLTSVDITGNSFCGCIPRTWTSTVLVNAATAANSALVATTCSSTRFCTDANYECSTQTITTGSPTTATPTVVPTVAPTTAAPTTVSPATAAPTTAAPTTAAPTTAAPTTAAPTTAAPTTAAPTTAAPQVCYVDHCTTCRSGFASMCSQCESGFNLRNDGTCMISGYCEAQHCTQCSSTDYTRCQLCNSGYQPSASGTCMRIRNGAASPASMVAAVAAVIGAVMTVVY